MKRICESLWVVPLLGALVAGCERSDPAANERAADEASAGKTAPQASAKQASVKLDVMDYEGIMELIRSQEGKVVVLDCWSTWCEPCMREFPGLVALHKKYGSERVACISLSFDFEGIGDEQPQDHRDKVLAFLEKQEAAFQNLISSDPSEDLYRKFDVASVPVVFVYDRQGKLAHTFDNTDPKREAFTYQDVEALVEKLLEQ